ncbi:hypothetical protein ATANTOWER_023634 [Ataeniobius toweri]|uniref:Uncharacterized protein n=1 Tax=Ataeniobius toweri TaxID=208326 RepID=A0ABU7ABT5_9TELE|nr:hypothetical protein [Ataeniobius toweri]
MGVVAPLERNMAKQMKSEHVLLVLTVQTRHGSSEDFLKGEKHKRRFLLLLWLDLMCSSCGAASGCPNPAEKSSERKTAQHKHQRVDLNLKDCSLMAREVPDSPCYLSPCYLGPCYLSPCYLSPCYLGPCYLGPCYLSPCYLSPCYLSPCCLGPCYLSPCYLSPCYLSPCYLSPCYLSPYSCHVPVPGQSVRLSCIKSFSSYPPCSAFGSYLNTHHDKRLSFYLLDFI